MMPAEIIAFGLLILSTVGVVLTLYFLQRYDYKQDRKLWLATQTDLLNRIQARSPSELAKLNGSEVKTDIKTAHDRNIDRWHKTK